MRTLAESRLKDLKKRGMKFGTAVTRAILDRLGSPDEKLKIVHIAGTNGKGSVAEFMTEILVAAGMRTGTFTSPQIYDYNDMFRVDGSPIADNILCGYLEEAAAAAGGTGATSFEVETAAALLAFRKQGCGYAVIECGMGGRDDATNAVLKKEVAVITSVSLEHTAYLGGTVTEICEKKSGIAKNCPVVIHPLQSEEGMAYLSRLGGAVVADMPVCAGDNTFMYKGKLFQLSAAGCEQPANAACAIEAARLLGIDEGAICSGIKNAVPRGRLEIVKKGGRTYILDGAHNPAAFGPLKNLLERGGLPKDKTIIYGCLSDKDIDGCLSEIAGKADKIIAVKPGSPRAMDIEKITSACKKYFADCGRAESVSAALSSADSAAVAVCGSFTILKEAKQWIEKE